MAENNLPNHTDMHNIQSTSRDNDTLDNQSVPSSASELQMSVLENRLENEMAKLTSMVKNSVSSLQSAITDMTDRMEKKFSDIDERFSRYDTDRALSGNMNTNRSTSLFGQAFQSNSASSQSNYPFSLTNALNRGGNSVPGFARSNQSCLSSHVENTHSTGQSKGDNNGFKMKPQTFNGTDYDDFIAQYEITCEINGWQYKEKSLYLANCLTGEARSLLNELDHEGKRDYNTLVEKLRNRFGSVNKSEIYRTQLKSRTRNKGETIPELAQAIEKMVRQAYPGINKEVIETLSLDHFIDAITDADIRLRLREAGPKSLSEAEQIAARIEAYKIADKQRTRLVG